ncbi:MAG: 6-phosphofructokinase [Myxococcota bacterium]|nr:6-phosphofructokinase [Myxococcota bacterium]
MGSFGILVGGGPAPGINGVIGAAATAALQNGDEVLGILSGFKWLMEGPAVARIREHVRPLSLEAVARVHEQGGSVLHTARANPTKDPEHLKRCVESLDALDIDRLITIGGDDTAFSAKCVSDASRGRIQVVHVPKTIDNDLPLPDGVPTFGYETARQKASEIVQTIHEDCRTTNRWFVLIVMGRHAGHLALGAGRAAGAPVSLIREEYPPGTIALDEVVRVIEGAIVKGIADGDPSGVAVVAEGVAELIDPADFSTLETVGRDEHGHIRLADLPFGKLLADAVKDSLALRGVSVAIGNKDVGYELRCVSPGAFDREYTRDLGVGAVRALLDGVTGALITRRGERIVPIPFDELMDPDTGRTRVRMVDVGSDSFEAALLLQRRVTAADLADPKRLDAIAAAAGLSVPEARERYTPLS